MRRLLFVVKAARACRHHRTSWSDKKLRRLLFVAIFFVFVLACGGVQRGLGLEDLPAIPNLASPPAVTQPTRPAVAQPIPTQSPADDLQRRIALAQGVAFKATYRATMTPAGKGPTVTTMHIARKPPKYMQSTETPAGKMWMFMLEDGIYSCAEAKGKAKCLRLSGSGPTQDTPLSTLKAMEEIAKGRVRIVPTGPRVIAGQPALCYRYSDTSQSRDLEVCLNPQGVLLFMAANAQQGRWVLEASQIGPVSDDDFRLPAPAESLPVPKP